MDPFVGQDYYQKIFQYFYSKKTAQYELFSLQEQHTKMCQLNVSLPGVPDFTYGVMLNSSPDISDNHIVIWDVFYTGQFYVSHPVYQTISHFKGLFPVFYMYNLNDQTTGVFNPDLNTSSPDSPIAQDIGDKTFIFYRYKDENYNGWAFTWTTLFNSSIQNEDNSQPELPFEVDTNLDVNDLTQDTLAKLFSNLTQDVSKTNEKISKLINTVKVSKQAKNLLSQINDVSFNSKNSSSCICSNFTCVSDSSSINIISKDHAFANAPEGFTYCSHPKATKSFNNTVAVCSWPTAQQPQCALYAPKTELIERRNSLNEFGNLLYDFEVSFSTLSNFSNVILIKNMLNDEVVNTITYPSTAKREDVIAESIRVLDDLIAAWSDLSQDNKNTILPQIESKPKKESYILSLA